MRNVICLFTIIALWSPCPAHAHGVMSDVSSATAVVVALRHEDGAPMAGESYEVFPPAGQPAFMVGLADGQGRVVFMPDRPGVWRVKVAGHDGHGAVATVDVDEQMVAVATQAVAPAGGRWGKLVMGVATLFGVFGIVALVVRRGK